MNAEQKAVTLEVVVDNPKYVLKILVGQEWELKNGNLIVGSAKNIRVEAGKLVADANIIDIKLFENYGSKAFIAGFPVKVRE